VCVSRQQCRLERQRGQPRCIGSEHQRAWRPRKRSRHEVPVSRRDVNAPRPSNRCCCGRFCGALLNAVRSDQNYHHPSLDRRNDGGNPRAARYWRRPLWRVSGTLFHRPSSLQADESHVSMRSLLHTMEVVRDCRRRKAPVVESGDVRTCNQEDGCRRRYCCPDDWRSVSGSTPAMASGVLIRQAWPSGHRMSSQRE
jgi:hypothetical protein